MATEELDKNRRNFLKFLLIGSGALILGKVFSPKIMEFFTDKVTENNFKDFRTEEVNDRELTIYDKTGEAIFIIDDKKE